MPETDPEFKKYINKFEEASKKPFKDQPPPIRAFNLSKLLSSNYKDIHLPTSPSDSEQIIYHDFEHVKKTLELNDLLIKFLSENPNDSQGRELTEYLAKNYTFLINDRNEFDWEKFRELSTIALLFHDTGNVAYVDEKRIIPFTIQASKNYTSADTQKTAEDRSKEIAQIFMENDSAMEPEERQLVLEIIEMTRLDFEYTDFDPSDSSPENPLRRFVYFVDQLSGCETKIVLEQIQISNLLATELRLANEQVNRLYANNPKTNLNSEPKISFGSLFNFLPTRAKIIDPHEDWINGTGIKIPQEITSLKGGPGSLEAIVMLDDEESIIDKELPISIVRAILLEAYNKSKTDFFDFDDLKRYINSIEINDIESRIQKRTEGINNFIDNLIEGNTENNNENSGSFKELLVEYFESTVSGSKEQINYIIDLIDSNFESKFQSWLKKRKDNDVSEFNIRIQRFLLDKITVSGPKEYKKEKVRTNTDNLEFMILMIKEFIDDPEIFDEFNELILIINYITEVHGFLLSLNNLPISLVGESNVIFTMVNEVAKSGEETLIENPHEITLKSLIKLLENQTENYIENDKTEHKVKFDFTIKLEHLKDEDVLTIGQIAKGFKFEKAVLRVELITDKDGKPLKYKNKLIFKKTTPRASGNSIDSQSDLESIVVVVLDELTEIKPNQESNGFDNELSFSSLPEDVVNKINSILVSETKDSALKDKLTGYLNLIGENVEEVKIRVEKDLTPISQERDSNHTKVICPDSIATLELPKTEVVQQIVVRHQKGVEGPENGAFYSTTTIEAEATKLEKAEELLGNVLTTPQT